VPADSAQLAELTYDNSSAARHHQATPLTLWLRVPLSWFRSATFSQFPDETHRSIQRTFVSPFASNTRRQFCGYCGTQLTSWHELTREDADFIYLTVGSLLDEDQEALGELGWLPGDSSDEEMTGELFLDTQRRIAESFLQPAVTRGAPWFEEMVESTKLGKLKRQKGGHVSRSANVKIEWEVVEWTEGDDADDEAAEGVKGKRKIGDIEAGDAQRSTA